MCCRWLLPAVRSAGVDRNQRERETAEQEVLSEVPLVGSGAERFDVEFEASSSVVFAGVSAGSNGGAVVGSSVRFGVSTPGGRKLLPRAGGVR